jgi:hypothetical protein
VTVVAVKYDDDDGGGGGGGVVLNLASWIWQQVSDLHAEGV